MGTRIDSITVVGGGDSGLLTALAIRRLHPNIQIRVVDDFDRSVPNVGKSTYRAIMSLIHDFLDIDEQRFVRTVKPVWKCSVYFEDWCGSDPFHFPFDIQSVEPFPDDPRSAEFLYSFYNNGDITTEDEQIVEQCKSPWSYDPRANTYTKYVHVAYHLDIERANDFLRTLCEERGIDLVDDRVTDVRTDGDLITAVTGENQVYTSDLYVDATGFNRLLIDTLENDYHSFDIPLDSAFHANVESSLEDVVPATIVNTGDYGWFWQIDTYDNRDLGYVFASEYVSDEAALAEFIDHTDEEFDDGDVDRYHFDSGFYENPWIGNCVANGNAAGFIEPLQSTALTTNLKCAQRLSRLLASHGRHNHAGIRDSYNSYVQGAWNSIYDFIAVHYKYANGENEFWEAMRTIPLREKIDRYVESYDLTGLDVMDDELTTDDGTELNMTIFDRMSLYLIMAKMGAKSTFYENYDFTVSPEVRDRIQAHNEEIHENVAEKLTHAEIYEVWQTFED